MRIFTPLLVFPLLLAGGLVGGCTQDTLTDTEYVAQAKDFQDQGKFRLASIQLKIALRQNPANVEARWLLGKTYIQLGNAEAAIKELRRAQGFGMDRQALVIPLGEALLLKGDYAAVISEVEAGQGKTARDQARILVMRADAFAALGQYDAMRASLEAALERYPRSVLALLGMGQAALLEDDYETTATYIEKATEVAPEEPKAWMLAGDLERKKGNYAAAAQAYRKAVELSDGAFMPKLALAWSLLYQNKVDQAEEVASGLPSGSGSYPSVPLLLGVIAYEKGRYGAAKEQLLRVVKVWPDHPYANLLLAGANLELGNTEQAEVLARHVLARYPGLTEANAVLGAIQLQRENPADAVDILQKGLARAPDNSQLLTLLGTAFLKQGDYSSATGALQQAAVAGNGPAVAKAGRAAESIAQGDIDKALEILDSSAGGQGFDRQDIRQLIDLMQDKQFDAVLTRAEGFHRAWPEHPVPLIFIGLARLEQGREAEARDALGQALERAPGDPTAARVLARLAARRGDAKHAEELYRGVLAQHPSDLLTLLDLAELDAGRGQLESARAWARRAIDAHPRDYRPRFLMAGYLLRGGEPETALKVLQPVSVRYAQDPSYLAMLGDIQTTMGKGEAAVATLRQLVEALPDWPRGHYLLAKACALTGEREAMRGELERTLQLEPGHFDAKWSLALLSITTNRPAEAEALVDELRRARPRDPQVLHLTGKLALLRKQPEQAVAAYQEALEIAPLSRYATLLANAQWQAGNREASLKTLKDWMTAQPGDAEVQSALADTYLVMKQWDAAEAAYKRLLQLVPGHAMALNNLAYIIGRTDPKQGLDYAERAYRRAPRVAEFVGTLATLLLRMGETGRAQALLEDAVAKAPQDPGLRYRLAVALARAGEKDRAREMLKGLLAEQQPFAYQKDAQALLKSMGG